MTYSFRFLKLLLLSACIFSLSGCFWGVFGGVTAVVINDTDDYILVTGDRNVNAYYDIGGSMRPDEERTFGFSGFDFDASVRANYRGREKSFHVHPNFFGFDWIHVHIQDFPPPSN